MHGEASLSRRTLGSDIEVVREYQYRTRHTGSRRKACTPTFVLFRIALPTVTFIAAMSAFWLPNSSLFTDVMGAQSGLWKPHPSASASLHGSGDEYVGFDTIYGVGTLAIGPFYHGLFLAWLHALRHHAGYRGPVFVGCDDCEILHRRLAASPHAHPVIFLPLSRERVQSKPTATAEVASPSSHRPVEPTSATGISLGNAANDNIGGSTGRFQKDDVLLRNGTSTSSSSSSFGGKGSSRAAKASKWHHVLSVAERVLRDDRSRNTFNGTNADSTAMKAATSTKAIRLLFLDVDSLATRHLGRWLQVSFNQLVGDTTKEPSLPSTHNGPGAREQIEKVTMALPHLLVGSGRRILGEPFNLGAFIVILDRLPNLSSLMTASSHDDSRKSNAFSNSSTSRTTVSRASTHDPSSLTSSVSGTASEEPIALACLRAAASAAEASSIGTARFRPRINDQEALSRVLASAGEAHHDGNKHGANVHNPQNRTRGRLRHHFRRRGKALGTDATAASADSSSTFCAVNTLPAGMQQFAASEFATWPSAELFLPKFEPPGLVHYTRAEQRLAGCTNERFKSLTPSSSQFELSPSPSDSLIESSVESHQVEYQQKNEQDIRSDDASMEWKSESDHTSGRRARSWWMVLWQHTKAFLGLNSQPRSECWSSYKPLLTAILNSDE